MMRNLVLLLVVLSINWTFSQELRAKVTVNYNQVANGNPQLFKNLEKQASELLNNTKWTEDQVQEIEKIECNFFINVTSTNFETSIFGPPEKIATISSAFVSKKVLASNEFGLVF